MKSKNSNFGKPLSREQMKRVTGGSAYCDPGQYAYCYDPGTAMTYCTLNDLPSASTGAICATHFTSGHPNAAQDYQTCYDDYTCGGQA